MDTKPIILIRGTECTPEIEEKFNTWYNERHIPMLFETGEIKSAARYKRVGDDDSFPKYLAIYEYESPQAFQRYEASPQLAAAIEDVDQTFPEGGITGKWRVQYEVIRTWTK